MIIARSTWGTLILKFVYVLLWTGLLFGNFGPGLNSWGVFHYFLNAKYFNELGYFELYHCALDSKINGTDAIWDHSRDFQSYKITDVHEPCNKKQFSGERWSDFENDLHTIITADNKLRWSEVTTDKGFNATPFWAVLFGRAAQSIDLGSKFQTQIFFQLDKFFLFASLIIVFITAGNRAALLTGYAFLFFFGTYHAVNGHYAQFIWVPFLAASAALWQKKRPFGSGFCLGLSAGFQAFPLFFAVPLAIRVIFKPSRRIFRYFAGIFLSLLVVLFLGSSSERGISAWVEWGKKISIHGRYLHGEIFNIGLPNLYAFALSPTKDNFTSYEDAEAGTFAALHSFEQKKTLYYIYAGVLLFAFALLVVSEVSDDVQGYGFIPIFILLSLSPYYYLFIALLPYMFWDTMEIRRLTVWGLGVLYLLHIPFLVPPGYVIFSSYPHLYSKIAIFLFLLSILTIRLSRNFLKSGKTPQHLS